jgi:hypothetical protein
MKSEIPGLAESPVKAGKGNINWVVLIHETFPLGDSYLQTNPEIP